MVFRQCRIFAPPPPFSRYRGFSISGGNLVTSRLFECGLEPRRQYGGVGEGTTASCLRPAWVVADQKAWCSHGLCEASRECFRTISNTDVVCEHAEARTVASMIRCCSFSPEICASAVPLRFPLGLETFNFMPAQRKGLGVAAQLDWRCIAYM